MDFFVLFYLEGTPDYRVFDIEAENEEDALETAWERAEDESGLDRYELMGCEARIVGPVLTEEGRVAVGNWVMDRHKNPDSQSLSAWFDEAETLCGRWGANLEIPAHESVSESVEVIALPRRYFLGAKP